MAQPVFTGPVPPEGSQWCTICAMVYKGAQMARDDVQVRIQAALRTEKETVISLEAARIGVPVPRLQEAVTQCMVIIPLAATGQQVPVLTWVCWSHIQGLQVKDGLIMPASASQMPTGPVPLLGR